MYSIMMLATVPCQEPSSMSSTSRHYWPMESYLSAWKIFRRLSDENVATAEHLVKQPMWPKRADLKESPVLKYSDGLSLRPTPPSEAGRTRGKRTPNAIVHVVVHLTVCDIHKLAIDGRSRSR